MMVKRTLLALTACMLILGGCGSQEQTTSSFNKPLKNFLSLHEQFCESDYNSPEELADALAQSDGFRPAKNINGIFEKMVDQISFAVSSEETGCTTDLKLKAEGSNKPYFDFNDLHDALIARGYEVDGDKRVTEQLGIDDRVLKIVEMRYISPQNTSTILAFPLEREDQYYMTLFAEKFNGNVKTIPINVRTAEI